MRFALLFFGLIAGITYALDYFDEVDRAGIILMTACLLVTLLTVGLLALIRLWKPLLLIGIPAFVVYCVYAWFAPTAWPMAEAGKPVAEFAGKAVLIVVGVVVGLFVLMLISSGGNGGGSSAPVDRRMFYEKHWNEWTSKDHGDFQMAQEMMKRRR
jgi:hypothetical protein